MRKMKMECVIGVVASWQMGKAPRIAHSNISKVFAEILEGHEKSAILRTMFMSSLSQEV